jgi:two-component system capsular synthesis response regulator RcsB
MEQRIRIIIADDHPAILFGARYILSSVPDFELVGEANRSTDLLPLLQTLPCDVLVTDLAMPGGEFGDGLPLLALIRRRFPALRLVVLTMLENPGLLRRIQELGVSGIVSKRDDLVHIGSAVRSAMVDVCYVGPAVQHWFNVVGTAPVKHPLRAVLSKREFEVVRRYVAGATIKEIAQALSRSAKTISTQKSAAMRKLGVERDTDLHHYALSNGLANVSLLELKAADDMTINATVEAAIDATVAATSRGAQENDGGAGEDDGGAGESDAGTEENSEGDHHANRGSFD